jgi:hypothetical protein
MVLARRCRGLKLSPGDRLALLVATRQSSRYLDGSCMKQEPPIERSEALREAPVFGSSPFGGELLPRGAPDEIMTPNLIDVARADRIKRTIR